jgi:PII-like signaling protein
MLDWTEATSLRVFISGDDTHEGRPLHEAIVRAAREAHMAGAKVTRGITGYGKSGHIHETWRGFSFDLPVVVEIIDTDAKIEAFLSTLQLLRNGALVTRHRVQILAPHGAAELPAA